MRRARASRSRASAADVDICRHWFTERNSTGNSFVCEKTGLTWDAASLGDRTLSRGIVKNAITVTGDGSLPPIAFSGGALDAFDPTKYHLLFTSGRVVGDGACRVAWGDNNALVQAEFLGFGMSDSSVVVAGGQTFHVAVTDVNGYSTLHMDVTETDVFFGAVDIATNVCTTSTNSYSTGDLVKLDVVTILDVPPLADGEYYYVISIDPTHIKLALTKEDALNGTAINLTGDTTGVSEFLMVDALGYIGVGQDVVTHCLFEPGSGCTEYKARNIDTFADVLDATVPDYAMSGTAITQFPNYFRTSGYALYSFGWFTSDSAFTDLDIALQAMGLESRKGHQNPYTGWAG